jgi:transaldolase
VISTDTLRVKIFADGADLASISELSGNPLVRGFTTNPTLMRQAGVDDFEQFALKAVEVVAGKPISFEVFTDEFSEMRRQAQRIASWGENVYAKIPVTNSLGVPSYDLISDLCSDGVRINVTAVFTVEQIDELASRLAGGPPSNISVFAGRIADAGEDPVPYVEHAVSRANAAGTIEVIWASPREVYNVVQADRSGCHIITVTGDVMKKLAGLGKDLAQFSLETVQMFHRDAVNAEYVL